MAKYSFDCEMGGEGHESEHFEVEADNDDEALGKMMEEMKPHGEKFHPEMAGKSPEELKEMITSTWKKEE